MLLGMPDTEWLGILKITCEVVGGQQQTGNVTPRQYNYPVALAAKQTED